MTVNGEEVTDYELTSDEHAFDLTLTWNGADEKTKIADESLNKAEVEVLFTAILNEDAVLGKEISASEAESGTCGVQGTCLNHNMLIVKSCHTVISGFNRTSGYSHTVTGRDMNTVMPSQIRQVFKHDIGALAQVMGPVTRPLYSITLKCKIGGLMYTDPVHAPIVFFPIREVTVAPVDDGSFFPNNGDIVFFVNTNDTVIPSRPST